jgi:hypothetical protein
VKEGDNMSELPESSDNYFIPTSGFLFRNAQQRVIEKNGEMIKPTTHGRPSDKNADSGSQKTPESKKRF